MSSGSSWRNTPKECTGVLSREYLKGFRSGSSDPMVVSPGVETTLGQGISVGAAVIEWNRSCGDCGDRGERGDRGEEEEMKLQLLLDLESNCLQINMMKTCVLMIGSLKIELDARLLNLSSWKIRFSLAYVSRPPSASRRGWIGRKNWED